MSSIDPEIPDIGEPSNEFGVSSSSGASGTKMTLAKAIEMGEYNPEYLATFSEWLTISRHVQFQYIKQALDNRYRHLVGQWAEINNFLDFSQKPNLRKALDNIQKQLKELQSDRERLYIEYSV